MAFLTAGVGQYLSGTYLDMGCLVSYYASHYENFYHQTVSLDEVPLQPGRVFSFDGRDPDAFFRVMAAGAVISVRQPVKGCTGRDAY